MSSGGCKCGSNCSCGSGCSCEMYGQDVEKIVAVQGVAPLNIYSEGSEKSFGGEGGKACKCGSSCTCDPCNC